jgi:hypothetical protein
MRMHAVLAAALGLLMGVVGLAQEPAQQQAPAKDDDFWFSTPRRRAATAAELVLVRNPYLAALMRQKAKEDLVWGDLEFALEFAPPLDPDWLDDIKDGRPLPNIAGKAPDEVAKADRAMIKAYNQALVQAFQLPVDVFQKTVKDKEWDHLRFPHLWKEPRIHRGKVVTVNGRLVRIRKYDAPRDAQAQGVKHVHEGWVFGETKGAHPYAVIFPILPEGFEVAESMNRPVTFHGYFMGKIRVRVPEKDIDVPLLIGPTLVAGKAGAHAEEEEPTPFPLVALMGIVAVLAGVVTLIFLISWWFRKGDSQIQERLTALQDRRTMENFENAPPWNDATEPDLPRPRGAAPPDETQRLP